MPSHPNIITQTHKIGLIVYTSLLLWLITTERCGIYGTKHGPTAWHRIQRVDFQQPPYARYLQGLSFCLDPGHGGDAHIPNYKRGPTGVREAEMNLRVARYLKEFLEQAGASVILTRTGDSDISLKDRAGIANQAKVDMFLSLHHNAVDKPQVNYASTWYHADADYSPVSLDVARYVQQSLVDILRLPDHLPTGLLSDYLMYPSGFGVLRYLEVPGILLESSFFSHPKEEKLLAKPAYNRLEAFAIFLGLARWAAAGLPKAELLSPTPNASLQDKQPTIRLKLTDGLHERRGAWMLPREQLFSRQISFFLDDSLTPFTFIRENSLLLHTPAQPLANGWHTVRAEFVNYHGNHNLPRIFSFRCAPPACSLSVSCPLPWLPADGISLLPIETLALDRDNQPVADGDTVFAKSDRGSLLAAARLTQQGQTIHYWRADSIVGSVNLTISSGQATVQKSIMLKDTALAIIEGFVTACDSIPLCGAQITCSPGGDSCATNSDGFFLLPNYYPSGHYAIQVQQPGFWNANQECDLQDGKSALLRFNLQPLYGGALHDFRLVVDASVDNEDTILFDGYPQKISTVNLLWARLLRDLFEQAGATVYLVNPEGRKISAAKRVEISNQFPAGGYYLKLSLNAWQPNQPVLIGGYYAGNEAGRKILTQLDSLLQNAGVATQARINTANSYEIVNTNRAALSLKLNLLQYPAYAVRSTAELYSLAWQMVYSCLQGFQSRIPGNCQLVVQVTDNGVPVENVRLLLQGQLVSYTDQDGRALWRYLDPGRYTVTIADTRFGEQSTSIELGPAATVGQIAIQVSQ